MLTFGSRGSLCKVGLKKQNYTTLMTENKVGLKSVLKNMACKRTIIITVFLFGRSCVSGCH